VAEIPHVRLNLSNRAENVLLVRQALAGLGELIGLDPVELTDVSTAVSEACNNVVVHAYSGDEGPLEVEVYGRERALVVVVRDHGIGIKPREADPEELVGGIGLPVIRALSEQADFNDLPDGGTEVRMRFSTTQEHPLEPLQRSADEASGTLLEALEEYESPSVTVGPTPLARTVIPRILSALAARAYFSTDRISDTQIVADTLVAHADGSVDGGRLTVSVTVAPRDLRLRIGPLLEGRAAGVFEEASVDGLGSVLGRLANEHEISQLGSAEVLGLRIAERDPIGRGA
jgi:serine/threonine-protein kinase RsbW